MLKRQQGNSRRAIARAPVLPFMDDTFDVVTAGFVLTHIPDFGAALVQMHRVLKRRGGRLGTTVWAGGTTPVSEIWRNAIERFVNTKVIQEEFARIIPWDELLSECAAVEKALERAGFVQIEANTNQYFLSIQHQDFIATKIGSIEGTIVREHLSEEAWNQFLKDLLIRLQRAFPDRIEYTREVHFISGQKQ
jgi:ubiquinone/menaquinone biosynthesis C-methylase UbiE